MDSFTSERNRFLGKIVRYEGQVRKILKEVFIEAKEILYWT